MATGIIGGDPDGVLDGIGVGTAVTNDAHAFDPQERRAAVFGIVEAFAELVKAIAGQYGTDLPRNGTRQRILQLMPNHFHQALTHLERHVADEAIADDDVGVAIVKVAAFDVADKVDGQTLHQRPRFVDEVVAFVVLFADGEQSHAGMLDMENYPRIQLTHDGELREHLGAGIDIGPDVDHDARLVFEGGKNPGERGAVHPGHHALHGFGGHHNGTGVAGGNDTLGGAFTNEARGDPNGRVLFRAHGLRSAIFHGDHFTGVMNHNGERFPVGLMMRQFAPEDLFLTDENDADVVFDDR